MRIKTKNKRQKIINALLSSNDKKYRGDFIRRFMDNLVEEKRLDTKKKGKNVI
jgi:predicted lipase